MNREKIGVRTSIVGIVVNVLLFAAKLTVGLLCGVLSLVADASNNLSDAGSSLISMISFKISEKPADRDHPFGHARIEYVASMVVSFIVMMIGFSLFGESVKKMLEPSDPTVDIISVAVLAVMLVAKLGLGVYYRGVGEKIKSEVIKAAATDSFSDCIATSAILVSMIVFLIWNVNCDAYIGAAVSVLIIIAGLKILNETKNFILGTPPDEALVNEIYRIIGEYPEVVGIHDMLIHSYGQGRYFASLHAEVDGTSDIFYTHDVMDNIEKRLMNDLAVCCTIHMDPITTDDEVTNDLREKVSKLVKTIDEGMSIHDFRCVYGVTHSNLIFDIAVPFEVTMKNEEIKKKVSDLISIIDSTYFAVISVDRM